MKLYYNTTSPAARKVTIAASLLGIELEKQVVDTFRGENQSPEFLLLNPNGKVPVLVDDDFVLWESNAIIQYLEAKKPNAALYPEDARARADITRWQSWHQSHWGPACGPYVFENVVKKFRGLGDPDPDVLAKAAVDFNRFGRVLDGHLATRRWLVGDGLTFADISVAPMLMYAELGRFPLDAFPHIKRWFAQIETLPAWAETGPLKPKS